MMAWAWDESHATNSSAHLLNGSSAGLQVAFSHKGGTSESIVFEKRKSSLGLKKPFRVRSQFSRIGCFSIQSEQNQWTFTANRPKCRSTTVLCNSFTCVKPVRRVAWFIPRMSPTSAVKSGSFERLQMVILHQITTALSAPCSIPWHHADDSWGLV